jgi:hypothetical protein
LTLWMFKNKQVLLILIKVHGGNLRVAKCKPKCWLRARILYVYHMLQQRSHSISNI